MKFQLNWKLKYITFIIGKHQFLIDWYSKKEMPNGKLITFRKVNF